MTHALILGTLPKIAAFVTIVKCCTSRGEYLERVSWEVPFEIGNIKQGCGAVPKQIPDIVIGRLPIYLQELNRLAQEGNRQTTSSHELGERLGISSAQIRKDLSHFGEFGKQGTGYHINYLIERLSDILNLTQDWSVVLVGAGNIGHALAYYNGFRSRGFRISHIFDNDPDKVGERIDHLVVEDVADMEEVIRQEGIEMAILAVTADVAQSIAERLIAVGIRAILSYAPVSLSVPEGIVVSYSDPVAQLQRMTYYLVPPQKIVIGNR
jgi:redox-sensing transcriptional repressor